MDFIVLDVLKWTKDVCRYSETLIFVCVCGFGVLCPLVSVNCRNLY